MLVDHDRRDGAFLSGFAVALDLLASPEVAARWAEPSVLAKMSVGALACHLGRQAVRVAELVAAESDAPPLGSAEEHYRRAPWVSTTSPDDPANDRSLDDAEAAHGAAALVRRAADALHAARRALAESPASVVMIPWQGWSLRREDFLLTRLVEIVVHTDDLALSIEVDPPAFPEQAITPVLHLLVALALERHGQSAIVSALSRAERSRAISAF